MFDICEREETNFRVSQAIYAYGISFNAVQAPSWQETVRAVHEALRVARD